MQLSFPAGGIRQREKVALNSVVKLIPTGKLGKRFGQLLLFRQLLPLLSRQSGNAPRARLCQDDDAAYGPAPPLL